MCVCVGFDQRIVYRCWRRWKSEDWEYSIYLYILEFPTLTLTFTIRITILFILRWRIRYRCTFEEWVVTKRAVAVDE